MIRRVLLVGVVALGVAVGGCFRATIVSGRPGAAPHADYDEKWHHGFIWGIVSIPNKYNLDEVCPDGWASVHTETSFVNGLVSYVVNGALNAAFASTGFGAPSPYDPQTLTVVCATPAGAPAAEAAPVAPAAPATEAAPTTPTAPATPK